MEVPKLAKILRCLLNTRVQTKAVHMENRTEQLNRSSDKRVQNNISGTFTKH